MVLTSIAAAVARSRFVTGLLGVAVGAVAIVGSEALAAGSSSPTYTGCLKTTAGSIYNVKQGNAPLAACNGTDKKLKLSAGDITSVVAGTGLTGGATTGDAGLSLAPSYQLPQGCGNGTVPVADQGSWGCVNNFEPFNFQAIPVNVNPQLIQLGTLEIGFQCDGTAHQGDLEVTNPGGVTASFNISYVQLGGGANDTGFNVAPGASVLAVTNPGSTGSLVWSTTAGEIETGTVSWFYDGGANSCQFHGELIHGQT